MNLDKLAKSIKLWSKERGLDTGHPEHQFVKVIEEVGELAEGIAKRNKEAIIDGLGDTFVTLVILAQQMDLDFAECVASAYEEIKDREGKMVNGIFIKESDLNEVGLL